MYAIRSYYETRVESAHALPTELGQPRQVDFGAAQQRRVDAGAVFQQQRQRRITSYNVCYTKLLRTEHKSHISLLSKYSM